MDAFLIAPGDDLQGFENFEKATQFLGFLTTFFQENIFDEANLKQGGLTGERLLKGS